MISIALIGGTGTGKSTVAEYLQAHYQAVWLDCDRIGHELLDTPVILEKLIARFGLDILQDGRVNRSALGRIVFADSAALTDLNEIVHPPIMEVLREKQAAAQQQGCPLCVLDGALLMDVNVRQMVDQVWAVSAGREIRIQRLAKGRKISRQAAERVMQHQISSAEYAAYADVVLRTDDGIEAIAGEIAAHLAELKRRKYGVSV